jgi:ABC-type lipoprotein export system ATPase subunit
MIKTKSLAYTYTSAKEILFTDLTIESGSQVLLLGESGSGKTTLLHLLGGLLKSQKGSLEVIGTDISKLSEHQLDRFRGQHYGFIFQRNHLIQALTVEKEFTYGPVSCRLESK